MNPLGSIKTKAACLRCDAPLLRFGYSNSGDVKNEVNDEKLAGVIFGTSETRLVFAQFLVISVSFQVSGAFLLLFPQVLASWPAPTVQN